MDPSVSIFSICFIRPIDRLMVFKLVSVPPSQRSVTQNWPQDSAASLPACCACFLVPTKRTRPHLPSGGHEKTAGGFELRQCLAEVDDVDPVAGIEDELLHLGVPTLGLM